MVTDLRAHNARITATLPREIWAQWCLYKMLASTLLFRQNWQWCSFSPYSQLPCSETKSHLLHTSLEGPVLSVSSPFKASSWERSAVQREKRRNWDKKTQVHVLPSLHACVTCSSHFTSSACILHVENRENKIICFQRGEVTTLQIIIIVT